jgi:sugar phosphate isomerase/epimerase
MSAPIHPRVSVHAASSLKWSLQQDIDFLKRSQISTMGVAYGKALSDPANALAMIRQSGLATSCVTAHAGGQSLIAPPDGADLPALRILKPSIDFAAALSRVPCYFASYVSPPRIPTDTAYDALVAALPPVVEYAAKIGVPLAIEHNHPSMRENGFIQSLSDAVELAETLDVGVCLELQNCWTERRLPEIFRAHANRFVVAQVSDYLIGETTRLNRRVPGDGSIPLEWLLGQLLDAGYQGCFEVEILGPAIESEGYESAILRSVDWLNERLQKWGA